MLEKSFFQEPGLTLRFVYNLYFACSLGWGDVQVTFDALLPNSGKVVGDVPLSIMVERLILAAIGLFLAALGEGRPIPSICYKAYLRRNSAPLNCANQVRFLQKFSGSASPFLADMVESACVHVKIGINLFMRAFSGMFGLLSEFFEPYLSNFYGLLLHARIQSPEVDLESIPTCAGSLEREVMEMFNSMVRHLSSPSRSTAYRLLHGQ